MTMFALRGAVTADQDTKEAIDEAVALMMGEILRRNSLSEDEIVSVLFSQTKDLRSRNAAAACRAGGYMSKAPLFCVQEADTEGALERAIRVLITVYGEPREVSMVYLKGASSLRPDYASR